MDIEAFLQSLPADKRDAARRSWLDNESRGVSFEAWSNKVRERYPIPVPTQTPTAQDVTAQPSPGLPAMVQNTIGQDMGGPRIPVDQLPRPGRLRTLLNTFGQGVGFNLGDEAAATLSTGSLSGPEYETARRLAEFQIGRGASDYPKTAVAGNVLGGVAQTMLLPSTAPERVAASGMGRVLGRGAAEGALVGGVSAAGAADPGDRLRSGTMGLAGGGALGTVGSAIGGAIGSRMGTSQGRRLLNIADEGETSIAAAQNALRGFDPDAPIAGADIIGPMGPSRIRAASVIPGPGQARAREVFLGRQASRPSRITGTLEDATGTAGMNPYQAAEDLRSARSRQAEDMYAEAYAEPLNKEGQALARIPTVRGAIDRLRMNRRNAGEQVATGRATTEELHSVRKILDAQSRLGPNASSAEKEAAEVLGGLRDRIDAALKANPRFAEADAAFTDASRVMEGFEMGRGGLQKDPAELEYFLSNAPASARLATRMGFPASVTRAVESGSARGALSRVGLGSTPRVGRARIFDQLYGDQPQVESRLRRLVEAEEAMLPTERAAGAEVIGSGTEPNRQSILEAVGTQGLIPTARRSFFRSFRSAPDPQELAQDVDVLSAQGPRLRQLLGEAATAQTQRGEARLGGVRAGRVAASLAPTLLRTNEVAERSQEQDALDRVMRTYGVSEEEARQMLAEAR